MNSKDLALLTAKKLDEKKTSDITILDISVKSGFADYFVIATASNLRLLSALSDYIQEELEKEGCEIKHIEGKGESGWILIDINDVIVNLFTPAERDRYQIEKIWSDCPCVEFERIAEEVK